MGEGPQGGRMISGAVALIAIGALIVVCFDAALRTPTIKSRSRPAQGPRVGTRFTLGGRTTRI